MHDPFKNMVLALEIESQSKHPDHKVGALVCGKDQNEQDFSIARYNFWPHVLEQKIGQNQKLGNASTTVHAEIAAMCACPRTEGADIYLTDLPCPNCAKAMAEARIARVYIDSHTHNTPLGLKIKPYFEDVSLPILESAGIHVYEINANTRDIRALTHATSGTLRQIEHPVIICPTDAESVNAQTFDKMISTHKPEAPFAACFAKSQLGNHIFMLTRAHRSIGLTKAQEEHLTSIQTKYYPVLQPLNRLLWNCARHGLKILPDYLYSSQTPTSREFVNMIGTSHMQLKIGNPSKCRDEYGLAALAQLQTLGIITLK